MNQEKENGKSKNINHNPSSEVLSLITPNQKELINLGKKRHRPDNMKKADEENEVLEENYFKEIKDNKSKYPIEAGAKKGAEKNKCANNNNALIMNEEEKSTNFTFYEKLGKDLVLNNFAKENCKSSLKPKNKNHNSENNAMFNNLSIAIKFMKIQNLSNEISKLMREFKINKESLESFYKLQFDNLTSRLAINRLSIMISFLQNSNLINIKRKIVESLMFELFTRYEDYFFLENYMPNKSNIQELKNLISKKAEENEEKSENDLKRLNEIINKAETKKKNDDSFIKIKEKYNVQARKINMVFKLLFITRIINRF